MAHEAAERLRVLVDAGEEIPYEVRESGDGSPLCRYEPLTERFVRDHAAELRELDSFGAACSAIEASDLAGRYLEEMGVAVPADPRQRAETAGLAFLCRLWMDSSDFSLDRERLDAAIKEVEEGGETPVGAIEVIVPLRGLQMPVGRLELAGASIVRADTVDVPAEAQAGDLYGASPWEPPFIAVTRVSEPVAEDDLEPGARAVNAFRRLVTSLRLFKAGGVGLGPHAWTRISGDRWRRISTGAGRARPGGYRLEEAELAELVALSRTLASPSSPSGRQEAERPGFPATLGRALSRFEAGLERNVVIEALNDHLLALRFVLEGAGPAGLGLSMRVAALCAEPEERASVKSVMDRATGLERELWSGEPAPGPASMSPADTAAELEELARAVLKDAACGHLGSDLRVTADEILLADGLAVGDGAVEQRGETAEWRLRADDVAVEDDGEAIDERLGDPIPVEVAESEPELIEELGALDAAINPEPAEDDDSDGDRGADGAKEDQMELVSEAVTPREVTAPKTPPADGSPVLRLIEQTRAEREARHERVADLFPRPETTEWSVREIAYDRTRRAQVHTAEQAS
jgi:hypothetical protein